MSFSKTQIENLFSYNPPTHSQISRYRLLREKARELATHIYGLTPASPEQTTAIRKLQEAVMFANAAIAINELGDLSEPSPPD